MSEPNRVSGSPYGLLPTDVERFDSQAALARVIPQRLGVAVPLEAAYILWQR